jgi:hypothetical protein
MLEEPVKTVNPIKSKPFNARLFQNLYEGMGSEHTLLMLHTGIKWLWRRKVLVSFWASFGEFCSLCRESISCQTV